MVAPLGAHEGATTSAGLGDRGHRTRMWDRTMVMWRIEGRPPDFDDSQAPLDVGGLLWV